MVNCRIGIDLGGTKTEIIVIDADSRELFRHRVPSVRNDYASTLTQILDLVAYAEQSTHLQQLPVGLGIPGSISRKTGLVKNANSTWLNGRPLQQDLSARLGRDVNVTNDANCLAVSEAVDGAGAGYDLVFAAILGTGCGAGIAYRGKPIVGPNGVAGEWGHNPLPWTPANELAARPCYCGKSGCQETFLSGTGLSLSYAFNTGETCAGDEIAARAAAGDARAANVLDDYVTQLARGFAVVINTVDPDVIVIGGGLSNVMQIYEKVSQRLHQYVFGSECDTPVLRAVHGDSSGVRGAAWLNSP